RRAGAPADADRHLAPDPSRHASSDIASTCTASTSPAVSNIVLTPVCSPGCRPAAVRAGILRRQGGISHGGDPGDLAGPDPSAGPSADPSAAGPRPLGHAPLA